MSKYKLQIMSTAQADLKDIVDYIAVQLREPVVARKQLHRLKEAIFSLQEFPERHELVRDEVLALHGIRKLLVDKYLVFYAIQDSAKSVNIIRVLHSRRNWSDLL